MKWLILLLIVLAGCAEGPPPSAEPTGPWHQLNDWNNGWQPTSVELQSLPR